MKTKSRFSALDVLGITNEISFQLEGAYLQNIYDLGDKKFVLKLTKKSSKHLLLVEPGVRFHFTNFDRENPDSTPSAFVMKLRKHLRDRRVTKFEQVGFDRIVHMEFSHETRPEMNFNLFFEFYSLGNIILTDGNLQVLSLLREVKVLNKTSGEMERVLGQGFQYVKEEGKSKDDLLKTLTESEPAILDKVCNMFSQKVLLQLEKNAESSDNSRERRMNLVRETFKCTKFIGYIVQDPLAGKQVDFCMLPESFNPYADDSWSQFSTFNDAIDMYFYQREAESTAEQAKSREKAIAKKFDNIKKEQEGRINALRKGIDDFLSKANLVEDNLKLVEDAILVINTGLQNDLNWSNLEKLIEAEKGRQRPIAMIIHGFDYRNSTIKLLLTSVDGDSGHVDVDIRLTGFGNANKYYILRKQAQEKLERTVASFEIAMKSAEAKVRADIMKEKMKTRNLVSKRKPLWFEKFNWFLSSDRYLVISGKDMHQNEFIVKKLLRKGDAYIHADIHGASSVIVKNHRSALIEGGDLPPIPHRTLVEAGAFSLCFSKAWESKIVTSAWWVHSDQVSKTAPSGEYLGTGSFMIRGKKNFLPPSQLLLGFGFLFILDEAGSNRVRNERLSKEALRDANTESAEEEPKIEKYIEDIVLIENDTERAEIVSARIGAPTVFKKSESQKPAPQLNASAATNSKKTNAPVRGKHGKLKKMKEKYKDQDDEEKEARMALIKSSGNKISETVSALQPRKTESKRTAVKPAADKNEPQVDIFEGNQEEITVSELSVLDCLVSNPLSEDVIIGAIPVAAPYVVVQHYKYRVKLTPGSLKRGNAVKTSLALIFSEKKDTMTAVERTMIKSVPDSILNSTMPANVRVVGSGVELSKIKRQNKQKK